MDRAKLERAVFNALPAKAALKAWRVIAFALTKPDFTEFLIKWRTYIFVGRFVVARFIEE